VLIYASTLWLAPQCEKKNLLAVIARWLATKTKTPLLADSLANSGEPRMRDDSRVWIVSAGDKSDLWAMRYTHPDSLVSGRRWQTEIGIRREKAHELLECSIVVQTNEISARVTAPINVSRPTLVRDIADACPLAGLTPGQRVITLNDDPDAAEAFLYGVQDERRKQAYVLISPDLEGHYLIDVERVRSLLIGLADVVVISPSADTYFLERVLGRQFAVWRGAVNIIFPQVRFTDRQFIETRRLRSEDLAELAANGTSPESEVLSIVTHRTNLPFSWRAISPERVQEAILRRELALRLQEAKKSGDQDAYILLLEANDTDQATQISNLGGRIEALEGQLSAQQDVERRLRYDLDQAKEPEEQGQEIATGSTGRERQRDSLIALVEGRATPEQSLSAIADLFPDRIVVLSSAWKAVKVSSRFRERERVFDLLHKLCDPYWCDMNAGKGDMEAGKVFGNSYAARESETVEANAQARKRRTFTYEGRDVTMMRHLKIGNKDSAAETLRIHFHWDAEKRKVVVGHCGPHLDFSYFPVKK
jgi:hypothetical protein